MSRVHVVSFCNLIGSARARRRKSTTFPADVTRLSPPPRLFEERAWDEATRGLGLVWRSQTQARIRQTSLGLGYGQG